MSSDPQTRKSSQSDLKIPGKKYFGVSPRNKKFNKNKKIEKEGNKPPRDL